MLDHYHTIIIGAGPGGLACAAHLGKNGIKPLVLERNQIIGPKVCAGGITWDGLIRHIPEGLAEKSFPQQHIFTGLQSVILSEDKPIIATIDRKVLGQEMLKQALDNNAQVMTSSRVVTIEKNRLLFQDNKSKNLHWVSFDNLVGADGSNSLVRRYLDIPCNRIGVGINYQIPGDCKDMEWHLSANHFFNGYGWIFPHKKTISIGAYADKTIMNAAELKKQLLLWADKQGYDLTPYKPGAATINYDFQGWKFGSTYLVGDAAGLASGFTGEGIYPAIISGTAVAKSILDPSYIPVSLNRLIKKHALHSRMVRLTGRNRFFSSSIAEVLVFFLRVGIMDFSKLEMTG